MIDQMSFSSGLLLVSSLSTMAMCIVLLVLMFLNKRRSRRGLDSLASVYSGGSLDAPGREGRHLLRNHFLDVSFEQAFKRNGLYEVMKQNAMEELHSVLQRAMPNLPAGVRIVKSLLKRTDRIEFTLSKKGEALFRAGKVIIPKTKDGKYYLPLTATNKGKKIVELFKGRKIGIAGKTANIADAIVAAANIISNIDIVNKLENLENRVGLLVEGRRIDQRSELESCFRLVREIALANATGEWNHKLQDLHHRLVTLRCALKDEIDYRLSKIRDPNDRFFDRVLRTTKSKDDEVYSAATKYDELLYSYDFATKFDFALCSMIGHPLSLDEDIKVMEDIRNAMNAKKEFLSDDNKRYNLDPYIAYLKHCMEKYRYLSECTGIARNSGGETIVPRIEDKTDDEGSSPALEDKTGDHSEQPASTDTQDDDSSASDDEDIGQQG